MIKTLAIASAATIFGSSNGQAVTASSNLYKTELSTITTTASKEQSLTLADDGKFDYHYSSETGANYEARFWLWSLSSIGINNNTQLLERYSKLVPSNETELVFPTTYIKSEKWNSANIQTDLTAFNLNNVNDTQITSVESFKENATWLWESEYQQEHLNKVKWGISISTYTDEKENFILQFTTGFDLQIKDKLDFDFGGQISPYFIMESKK
ncbi:hypothetical protein CG007_02255 [Mesoplasma entomophilum]|uniref:hypothetical protein n=1 Tax=Mesoplasma entomophilum TaxID=2149 RepID=UPI000D045437|nr:hypothetical protein [Mesoplasma entomophilum]AVN60427.1 hypothetical protein CG007_02255 [Mesoplasma entomophilum]